LWAVQKVSIVDLYSDRYQEENPMSALEPRILVTVATGQLGRLVVGGLLG